jgi:transcription antitermination factor NusG
VCAARFNFKTELGAADTSAVPHWFAVYTMPRHEKRVAEYFQVKQIEHFLPLYSKQRCWKNGLRQIVQFPLFPNYLFVWITRKEQVSVLETPGVVSLIGDCNESSSVGENYIRFLRESLAQSKLEPHPYLVSGEKVRIKTGAMSGMEGVLIRSKSGFRVVVALELIKRSVAVEFDIVDIEPSRSILRRYIPTETVA